MKSVALLATGLQLAAALPVDPTDMEMGTMSMSMSMPMPMPSSITSPTVSLSATPSPGANPSGQAPEGCKLLNTDSEWPAPDIWTAALPSVTPGADTDEGNRPDYILKAMDVGTVQAAVKFAGEHNIRLSVVSSGHDFLGRNDAPAGLSLDISMLGGIRVLESFTPSEAGAESPSEEVNVITPVPGQQAAVTFGAGLSTGELNEHIDASGLFTIGAAHDSVRIAGGYGQTSGHAPFSSKYGLGADQVLEYKAVMADGNLVVVNSVVNTDLFWALRGGGGGTFGVVVEATVKAYPTPKITVANWWINATDGKTPGDGFWDSAAYLHSQFPTINKQGVQGYYYVYPNAIKGIFLTADEDSGQDKAKAIWTPILEKLGSFDGMEPAESKYTDYPNYVEFFEGSIEGGGSCEGDEDGHEHEHEEKRALKKRHDDHGDATPQGIIPMDSRLLGQKHLESPDLAQALKNAMPQVPQGQLRGHLVGGGKVFELGNDTSVLPAWRQAYVHLIGTGAGIFTVDSLRTLAPDSGAYINEGSANNPNWKNDFWGSNYGRLSEIKTKYDPKGTFWVSPGINADEYSVVDGRVCKIPTNDDTIAPANDNENIATHAPDNETGHPFPGTEPDEGTCPAEPGLPEGFYDEADLDASEPPTTEGATLTKIRSGPYRVDAMGMIKNRPDLNLKRPCTNCFITAIQADLQYENGTTANVNTGAWLHHMVLYKNGLGNRDLVCDFPLAPQRIYASGNERSVSRTNGAAKYGIQLKLGDSLGMIYDLMNESDEAQDYYMTITYEWLPGTSPGYKDVDMAWLDITGCGLSAVPAQQGQFALEGPEWKSTANGLLLFASGHVHNGGVNTTIFLNDQAVCTSRQVYGLTPEFIAPGHGMDMGDGHDHMEGKPSISDAEACVDFGEVKVGDTLKVVAYYDTDLHPLDEAHDGSGFEDIMGISRVYIGT